MGGGLPTKEAAVTEEKVEVFQSEASPSESPVSWSKPMDTNVSRNNKMQQCSS